LTQKVITKDDLLKLYKKKTGVDIKNEEGEEVSQSPQDMLKECQNEIDTIKQLFKLLLKMKVMEVKKKLPDLISRVEKLLEDVVLINDAKANNRVHKTLSTLMKIGDKLNNKEFETASDLKDYIKDASSVFDMVKLNEDALEYLNKSADDIKNLKEIVLDETKKEPIFIVQAPLVFALEFKLKDINTRKLQDAMGMSTLAGYTYFPKTKFLVGNTKLMPKKTDPEVQLKAVLQNLNKKLTKKLALIEDVSTKSYPFVIYWVVPAKADQAIEQLLAATVDYSIFIK